jgi:tRNA(fMet)-specific endonuclease VapC
MLRYMLDTNFCIRVIRNRPESIREQFDRRSDELCISTITLAELMFGAEKWARPEDNRAAVQNFSARLEVVPFSDVAAAHYGSIRADLERRGCVAGVHDMLIGAHARSEGFVVVTSNVGEFARMLGLQVENWGEP